MFYRLKEYYEDGLIDLRHLDFLQDKPGNFQRSVRLFSGLELPNNEKFVVVEEGVFPDIVQTGAPYHFLISQRLAGLFLSNHITGISPFPVILMNGDLQQIDREYYGLSVTGRSGPLRWYAKKSEREIEHPHTYREAFDVNSWDGSDIFLCEILRPGVFCTEGVKRILEKEKLRNLEIAPLNDLTPIFNLDDPEIVWED